MIIAVSDGLHKAISELPVLTHARVLFQLRLVTERPARFEDLPYRQVVYVNNVDEAFEVILNTAKQLGDAWKGPSLFVLRRNRKEYRENGSRARFDEQVGNPQG